MTKRPYKKRTKPKVRTKSTRTNRLSKRYHQYMGSKEWFAKRDEYFASAYPKECQCCGNPKVDLHHLTYERFTKELVSDLLPLCRQHHQELHQMWDDIPPEARKMMKLRNFTFTFIEGNKTKYWE